jgi:hypothetical protein
MIYKRVLTIAGMFVFAGLTLGSQLSHINVPSLTPVASSDSR